MHIVICCRTLFATGLLVYIILLLYHLFRLVVKTYIPILSTTNRQPNSSKKVVMYTSFVSFLGNTIV